MIRLLFAVALAVGHLAPDVTLLDQNNKSTTLAAARGHKAVIVFYRGYW